jgi:hypothetical protein
MKKRVEHVDPLRFPKVQAPIEDKCLAMHSQTMKQMIVDVTKELVKQKK